MQSKDAASVVVDTNPTMPKHVAGMFAELIRASEDSAKWARRYLESGDLDDARMFMNARMRVKNLGTKQALPRSEGKIMTGLHPLDDEERKQVLELLKEE